MRASLITPTFGRHELAACICSVVLGQQDVDFEWLIHDDTPVASPVWSSLRDERVVYVHDARRATIGAKRDWLVRRASGDVIIHIDDDDYYSPRYVSFVLSSLESSDFVTFGRWLVVDSRNARWYLSDTTHGSGVRYRLLPSGQVVPVMPPLEGAARRRWVDQQLWGYGFTYAYRRSLYGECQFDPLRNKGEDYAFVRALREIGARMVALSSGLEHVVHVVGDKNTSQVFPNERVAPDMARSTLGDDWDVYVRCRADLLKTVMRTSGPD